MKKIILLTVGAFLTGLALAYAAFAEEARLQFSDVTGHWGESGIMGAVGKGYVQGYPDGTFRPDRKVSYAEFLKMTVDALGMQTNEAAGGKWYAPYVEAATRAKIYKTSDFEDASWDAPIPRKDMAMLAGRAVGAEMYSQFAYQETAEEYLYVAANLGLVKGMGAGKAAPEGETTRAQAVTIIERMLKVKDGQTLEPADRNTRMDAELAWHRTNMYTALENELHFDRIGTQFGRNGYVMETKDGLYKGEMLNLYVIDLEDPNDPYRHVVKDIDSLIWMRSKYYGMHPIKDFPESYLLYFSTKIHYNKDTSKYADTGQRQKIGTVGFGTTDINAFIEGDLNGLSAVYTKTGEHLPGASTFILPKARFDNEDSIAIDLISPGSSNATHKTLTLFTQS
ncbi:S-layer homology domain-containing protein [Paenibacillus sp. IB182496]|uniref:S-layer homology domain-containing protein n=1 Tax=Paenibacillus sabuli TaxID=2772509 RepID=A0A927GSR9_9BACL|nr:S-layer homology domain-containing protein [Paenibacillus sabuli]MBD2847049.1 S-layer homology domain-containing protein [Paenibacillus sabuli]